MRDVIHPQPHQARKHLRYHVRYNSGRVTYETLVPCAFAKECALGYGASPTQETIPGATQLK